MRKQKFGEKMAHKGSGGTDGGIGEFIVGFLLAAAALYFFFDSVRVSRFGAGMISQGMGGRGGMGMGQTTSMGILFVPFFIGVIGLFYDAKQRWAWVVMWMGVAMLVVEILSSLRFEMNMKMTMLLLMLVMFAAGTGLMLRSYRPVEAKPESKETPPPSPTA